MFVLRSGDKVSAFRANSTWFRSPARLVSRCRHAGFVENTNATKAYHCEEDNTNNSSTTCVNFGDIN